ncbi:MAG: hypothetical protein K6356_13955 [Chloroflexus sp.]
MTRDLTPWQQLAIEAIQEDERLTSGLDDERAGLLLRWATAKAAELARAVTDDAAVEALAQVIRRAVRAAARADGSIATAERALTQALPALMQPPADSVGLPAAEPFVLGSAEPMAASLRTNDVPPTPAIPVHAAPPPAPPTGSSRSISPSAYRRRWLDTTPLSLLAHLGRR